MKQIIWNFDLSQEKINHSFEEYNGKQGIYSISMMGKVIYVGQSVNIGNRWRNHLYCILHADDYGFKYKQMNEILNAFLPLEFDIIEEVADHHQLDVYEDHYILKFKPGLNSIIPAGNGKHKRVKPKRVFTMICC